MKKTLRYTIFFWTVFVISSCVQPFDVTDRAKFSGKYGMNISVICTTPETKADGVVVGPTDKPGEDVYNENTVDYVDYYIFKSDSDTGAALIHDRATKVTTVSGTTNNPTYEVVRDLDMDEWVVDGQHSFYVYTIANMPELEHSQMPVTLTDLKNLGLVTAFNNDPFDEQNNFVMRGGETVTFPEGDQGGVETVVPKLSRVAAKVTINMNIAPAIDQVTHMPNGAVRYDMTWYPDLSDIDVYLSFANKETKIAGDPISWSAEDQNKFFTYYRDAFVATVSPETSTTPDWDAVSWRWNVTGTPFYTYPMSWTADSPQAPFLKVILKWEAHKEGDPHEPPYYVQTEDGEKFVRAKRERKNQVKTATEYYYKIPIPSEVLNSNDWYNLTFDVAILGSTAEELPVILAGQYYVTDWSDPKVTTAGDLKQDRYLTTASDTYYIYGGNDIEIPVTSSHALNTGEAVVTERRVYYNNQWVTTAPGNNIPNQVTGLQSRTLSVTASEDGRSYIKFSNELNIALDGDLDCYPMRFKLKLSHSDGLGTPKEIFIYQYPPIFVESKDGGNAMVDGYYGNVNGYYHTTGNGSTPYGSSGTTDGSNSITQTPYAPLQNYARQQKTMTVITISSLGDATSYTLPNGGGTFDYLIADPRQNSDYHAGDLEPHYKGVYNQTNSSERLIPWTDTEASSIKVGSTSTSNFIAPRFMVSSRWGKMGNWTSRPNTDAGLLTAVQKRCATYQEAGYPAGRWRLPTNAEIMFIAKLQQNHFIDELFSATGYSISASGGVFTVTSNNVSYSTTGGTSCRCVYDLWYWGEDPVEGAMSTYTIAP